jgi:hypothetical protein
MATASASLESAGESDYNENISDCDSRQAQRAARLDTSAAPALPALLSILVP